MKSGFYWGVISIMIWSTAATIGGLLTGKANAVQIVVLIQVSALASYLFIAPRDITILIADLRRIRQIERVSSTILWVVTLGIFITIYHLSFFYSIQNMPRIQANIINYLWPLFLIFYSTLVFKISQRPLTLYDVAIVMLALSGAIVIAWDIPGIGTNSFEFSYALAAAFLASATAPIYMCTSVVLSRGTFTKPYFPFMLAFLVSLPVFSAIVYLLGAERVFPTDPSAILLIVFLGAASVAFAQVTWSRALNLGPVAVVSSLAYLVPVLSTALLIAVLGDQPSPRFIFGATLIIVANILVSDFFRIIRAESAALVAFFFASFILYLGDELGYENLINQDVPFIGELFAILSGFFLAHVWQMNRDEKKSLLSLAGQLEVLCQRLHIDANSDEKVKQALDDFVVMITDLDAKRTRFEVARSSQALRHEFSKLEGVLIKDLSKQSMDYERIWRLRESIEKWMDNKIDRASPGEVSIVGVLGLSGSSIVLFSSPAGSIVEILAAVFVACTAYVVFKIRDLNSSPTIVSALRLWQVQSTLPLIGRLYYLPSEDILFEKADNVEIGRKVRVRQDSGEISVAEWQNKIKNSKDYYRSRLFMFALLAIGISSVISILLLQRAPLE